MVRSIRVVLLAAGVAVALGAAPAAAASTVQVSIRNASYDPAVAELAAVGDSVKWTNVTSPSRVHDVVSSLPDYFRSNLQGSGGTFRATFGAAGYFTYICSIHDTMLGAISVPLLGESVDVDGAAHFRLTVGTTRLPRSSPYLYVILVRAPGEESLHFWRTKRNPVVDFVPSLAGDYVFAARLKQLPSNRPSGNSSELTLTYAPPG